MLRGVIIASYGHGEDNAPRCDRVQVVIMLSPESWVFEFLQIWQVVGEKKAPCPQCRPARPYHPCHFCM